MSTSITVGKAVVSSSNPYVTLTVTESATSATANTSTLTYSLVIYRPSSISSTASKAWSFSINGTSYSGTTTIGGSGSKTITSGTQTVSHSSDGTKSISLSLSFTFAITWSGTYMGTYSTSGTMTLTSLDRTAPTITISSYSSTSSTITIAATSNVSCNTWQYSTNGGSSYTTFNSGSATSVSKTISSLSANTTYSVRIRAYKVANNISSYASASITTLGASSITSASSVALSESGTACSVKFTPYSTSYYYTLKFVVGSKTVTTSRFCPGTTSAYTYTGYSFDLETWAPYITSATSATCTATLTTYASSSTTTAMGTSSKTFTVSVPSSVVPVINSVSFAEAAEDFPEAFEGVYVQGVSQLAITVDAEGIYSSTISAIAAKVEGTTYDATDGATTDTITGSGDISVSVTITDSRGRTASGTYTVEVAEYYTPTLYLSYSTTSSTLAVTASGGVAEVDGLNTATLTYHVEETSDSSVYYDAELDIEAGSYSETYGITDDSAQTVTWSIIVTVADALNSTTVSKTTGVTALSFLAGGKGAAFGKEADAEGLEVAWESTEVQSLAATGTMAFGGMTFAKDALQVNDDGWKYIVIGDYMICWISYRCSDNVAVSTAHGDYLYRSGEIALPDYPIEYTAYPSVSYTLVGADSGYEKNCWVVAYTNHDDYTPKVGPGPVLLLSAISDTRGHPRISVIAFGAIESDDDGEEESEE